MLGPNATCAGSREASIMLARTPLVPITAGPGRPASDSGSAINVEKGVRT